ncbi:MAG: hypothetical protein Tsb0034_02310 [Ekhidna sp.]
MQDILRNLPEDKQTRRAWIGLFILLTYFALYVLINVMASSMVQIDEDYMLSQDPISLLITQAVSQLIMFIVVAVLISYSLLKFDVKDFFSPISWKATAYTIGIGVGSMVIISAIGEWNMNLDFGDSDFSKWARKSEDQLKVVTEHITNFQSFQHFLMAFLAVGIVPAIGEELIFRGLIQNFFLKTLKNHHVAIWLTGFIFAAIHLQFFGFAPRMILGVVFGYLYHWSGKLTVAMIGHLVNNGLALILLYLAHTEVIQVTPEQMEQSAPWPAVLLFGAATAYLLFRFKKEFSADA